MALIDPARLKPQLRFWSVHVTFTALPSFIIALIQFNTAMAILAMVAGIVTFIVGYTVLCSSALYGKLAGESVLGEAVRKGARIRMILSLVTAPLLMGAFVQWPTLFFAPDFWAGWLAVMVVSGVMEVLSPADGAVFGENGPTFVITYFVVILEGLIISFTLVLLTFFCLLVLNRKASRQGVAQG